MSKKKGPKDTIKELRAWNKELQTRLDEKDRNNRLFEERVKNLKNAFYELIGWPN